LLLKASQSSSAQGGYRCSSKDVRVISTKSNASKAVTIADKFFSNKSDNILLLILPVDTNSSLKGTPNSKNELTKSASLVITTRCCSIEIWLMRQSGVQLPSARAAYYPQTTPYNINNFPAARNQHTKAVKQHTLAT
jgi:hypothetical protein